MLSMYKVVLWQQDQQEIEAKGKICRMSGKGYFLQRHNSRLPIAVSYLITLLVSKLLPGSVPSAAKVVAFVASASQTASDR